MLCHLLRASVLSLGNQALLLDRIEAAVAAGCRYIVTFNVRDFESSSLFSIRAVTPKQFLLATGALA